MWRDYEGGQRGKRKKCQRNWKKKGKAGNEKWMGGRLKEWMNE